MPALNTPGRGSSEARCDRLFGGKILYIHTAYPAMSDPTGNVGDNCFYLGFPSISTATTSTTPAAAIRAQPC